MSEDVSWSAAAQEPFTCQVSDWIRRLDCIGVFTLGEHAGPCASESNGGALHRLNELTQAIELGGQPGGSEARIQMRVLILKRLRVSNDQVADLAHENWTICHRHVRALTAEYPMNSLCFACQRPGDSEGPGSVIEPLMQDALASISIQAVTGQPVCGPCQMKLSSLLDSITASGTCLPVDLFRQCLIDQNLFPTQSPLTASKLTRMVHGPPLGDLDVLRNLVWTTISFSEAFALTSSRVPTLRWISRDRGFRLANAWAWSDLTVRECLELFLTWKSTPRRFLRETLMEHYRRAGVIQDWSEHRICAQLCLGIFEKVENLYVMSVDNEKKTGFWSKMKIFLSLRLAQVIYIPKDAEESDSLMSVIYQEDRDDSRPTTLCLSCPDLECQSCRELVERPYFSAHRRISNPPPEEDTRLSVFVTCQFNPTEPNLISQSGRIPSLRLLAAGLNQKTKPKVSPKMDQQVTIALVLDFYLTFSANEPKKRSHQCHLLYMDFRYRKLFCSTSKERFLDKVISVRARIEHLTKVSQNGTAQTIEGVAKKLRKLLLTPFSCSEPINEPSRQGFLISTLPSLGLSFSANGFLKTEYLCCSCATLACTGTCLIPLVPLNATLTCCDRNQPPLISTPSHVSKMEPLLNKWSNPNETSHETEKIMLHNHVISNGANNQRPSFYSRSTELVQMYLNPCDLNGILEYLNCQPLEDSVSWQVSRITDDEILFQRKDKEVRAELQNIERSYTKCCFRGNALSAFEDEILPSLLKITSSYLVSDGDLELFKHIPNHGKQTYPTITNGHYPKMETQDHFVSEEDVKIETLDFHSMVEDHLSLGDLTDQLIPENTDGPGFRLSVSPNPKNHTPFEEGYSRGCDTPPPPLEDSIAHHSFLGKLEEWHENCDGHPQDNRLNHCPKGEQLMLVVPPIMKKPKVESVVSMHSSTTDSVKMNDQVANVMLSKSDNKKAIGQHAVVCKIGRFACPICGTIYRLNQPYGKHVANRDCTKTKHEKRTPSRDEFTLLYVMIHPGREGTDSTIGYGRVPSLRLLCRGIQMNSPCIPPSRLPPLTNKECLEINFSLKRSDKAFEREERWKYLTQRHIFHHIGNCVMFLNLGNNVLKVVDMLEKKIKAAKAKSNLPLVQQWNDKLTTYLGVPFHDNLNIAKVGKFKAYEYPSLEGTSVKVLCLNCPQNDCYGCAEMGSSRTATSKKTSTQPGANKKKKKKLVLKRGNKHQRDYYAAVGVWKTKAKLKEARQSVGQVLGYRRVATYSEVINHELKLRAALQGGCGPSNVPKSLLAASSNTCAKPGPKSKKTRTNKVRSKPSLGGSPASVTNGGGSVLVPPDGHGHEVSIINSITNDDRQEKRQAQRHNQYEQDQEQHVQGLEQHIYGHYNHQYEYASDNGTDDYSHVFMEQAPPSVSLPSSNLSNELHRMNSLNTSNQQSSISQNHVMPSWMSASPYNGHFEQPETTFQNVGMDTNECILPD